MPLRASRKALTDALSSHYGSPGRLASYRCEFDKTVRKPGEDPSNFAITLETLAVKAFGDMGQTAHLRLIRDRFIAGHGSCDLRRYLDCVPPDTPLRDIVDRCRVWESHTDPEPAYPTYVVEQSEYETEPVQVVTVNKPNSSVDQSEDLLKKLLAVLTPIVPPPPPDEGSRIITDGQASPTVVIGNREEKTGPSDAGRASGVRNIASNILPRATIVATGAQTAADTT